MKKRQKMNFLAISNARNKKSKKIQCEQINKQMCSEDEDLYTEDTI